MQIDSLYKAFLESSGVSTDTRSIDKDALFFALKGERFDGNTFVNQALAKGAKSVIIDDPTKAQDNTILVPNVLKALQQLATHHRDQLSASVLAITGSNGKTTTKELITAVLSSQYKVHATPGNLNNHIGVPLTLLSTPLDTEILVVEMGANHIGEIRFLCQLAKPDYGLITNVGKAHLEGFGSYNGVILGKTELYRHIAQYGKHVFYDKYDKVLYYNLPHGVKTMPYIRDLIFNTTGLQLNFKHKDGIQLHKTGLTGKYNIPNVLAARTIGHYFRIPDEKIFNSLTAYQPRMNRSQLMQVGTVHVILDAYNANPSSMEKSISSFASMKSTKPKFLVLGDMKELGSESLALHEEILKIVTKHKWAGCFLIGEDFQEAAKEYGQMESFKNFKAFELESDRIIKKMDTGICLLKGSRSMKLERFKDLLNNAD